MATVHPSQLVVGLTGLGQSGEVGRSSERFLRIDLPRSFNRDHVELMQKDLAALAEIVAAHPEDVTELQNAVLAHNFGYASQVAEKIGLTEAKLVERGGGKIGIAGGILVALVLYALLSEGHESPPPAPTPPQPPTPPDPIVDAGTG